MVLSLDFPCCVSVFILFAIAFRFLWAVCPVCEYCRTIPVSCQVELRNKNSRVIGRPPPLRRTSRYQDSRTSMRRSRSTESTRPYRSSSFPSLLYTPRSGP